MKGVQSFVDEVERRWERIVDVPCKRLVWRSSADFVIKIAVSAAAEEESRLELFWSQKDDNRVVLPTAQVEFPADSPGFGYRHVRMVVVQRKVPMLSNALSDEEKTSVQQWVRATTQQTPGACFCTDIAWNNLGRLLRGHYAFVDGGSAKALDPAQLRGFERRLKKLGTSTAVEPQAVRDMSFAAGRETRTAATRAHFEAQAELQQAIALSLRVDKDIPSAVRRVMLRTGDAGDVDPAADDTPVDPVDPDVPRTDVVTKPVIWRPPLLRRKFGLRRYKKPWDMELLVGKEEEEEKEEEEAGKAEELPSSPGQTENFFREDGGALKRPLVLTENPTWKNSRRKLRALRGVVPTWRRPQPKPAAKKVAKTQFKPADYRVLFQSKKKHELMWTKYMDVSTAANKGKPQAFWFNSETGERCWDAEWVAGHQ